MKPGTPYAAAILVAMVLVSADFYLAAAGEPAVKLQVLKQVVLDDEAWKWNWASWDQEKIATFGNFQYTVFWDADRVMVLARRDLRDDSVETLRLPDCRLSSDDRHRNTCLGFSPADGRLHLSWDHHNNPLHYTRSRPNFLTKPPEKLAADQIEPAAPMLADPKLEAKVTYPRFFHDGDGNLYLCYRIGGSGDGDNFLHRYNPADGSWTRLGMLFSSRGIYGPWQNDPSRCAYLHDLLFDAENRLHASWTYREIAASWASNHDLHYATSDDRGMTWKNNAGEKIGDLAAGDPIELADRGIIVREIPVFSWLMNAGCLAFDSKNRPHVVTYMSRRILKPEKLEHGPPPELSSDLCFVHFWRADDGTWRGGEMIDPGPTGKSRVDVIFTANDDLIFFYPTYEPVEAGFRYFTASGQTQWADWSGPHPLTSPELSGQDASKHDRCRWAEQGILSFTAKTPENGLVIVDVELR